jgi:hypothetical protein
MWWKKTAMTLALDSVDELYRSEDQRGQWWKNRNCGRIASVISIGDDEAEMQAAALAVHGHEERQAALRAAEVAPKPTGYWYEAPPSTFSFDSAIVGEQPLRPGVPNDFDSAGASHWPYAKLLKCKEHPHIRQLTAQLQEIVEVLPHMVLERRHFRISMERPECRDHSKPSIFDPWGPYAARDSSDLVPELLGIGAEIDKNCVEWKLRMQSV